MRMGSGLRLVRGSPEGRASRQSLFSNQNRSNSKWGTVLWQDQPILADGSEPLGPAFPATPRGDSTPNRDDDRGGKG